jgi:hypothetical protein
MKKITALVIAGLCFHITFAQEDPAGAQQGVDLLKAPSSPASQLLNIAPSAIERPTDLSSFWLSITNSTSNLTKVPTNYAFDISPAALFGRPISLKDLSATNTREVMRQSFVLSAGIRTDEDTINDLSFYKSAVGFKVSFVRPAWTAETNRNYKTLVGIQRRITDAVEDISISIEDTEPLKSKLEERDSILRASGRDSEAYKKADAEFNELRQQVLETALSNDATLHALKENLKVKAREFKIVRRGWFLDLAGGVSFQFPTNELGYSLVDRSGAWLTGGHEGGDKKLSVLAIARYLYQPEKIFADPSGTIPNKNISTFDAGTRVLYSTDKDQFSFSFESMYRSVLTNSIVDPSWRLVFSVEYDIGFNQKISFNFGRDFDGTTQKGGTLIGWLNFIAGFGNKRAVK